MHVAQKAAEGGGEETAKAASATSTATATATGTKAEVTSVQDLLDATSSHPHPSTAASVNAPSQFDYPTRSQLSKTLANNRGPLTVELDKARDDTDKEDILADNGGFTTRTHKQFANMIKDNGLTLVQKREKAQELIREAYKTIYPSTIDYIVGQLYTAGLNMLEDMAEDKKAMTTRVAALSHQLLQLDNMRVAEEVVQHNLSLSQVQEIEESSFSSMVESAAPELGGKEEAHAPIPTVDDLRFEGNVRPLVFASKKPTLDQFEDFARSRSSLGMGSGAWNAGLALQITKLDFPCWIPQQLVANALGVGTAGIAAATAEFTNGWVWASLLENVHTFWDEEEPRVVVDGVAYECSEVCYQSQKEGRSSEEFHKIKFDVMEKAPRAKMRASPRVEQLLRATGTRHLLSIKDDEVWGWDPVKKSGGNHLALIWMRLRAELQSKDREVCARQPCSYGLGENFAVLRGKNCVLHVTIPVLHDSNIVLQDNFTP